MRPWLTPDPPDDVKVSEITRVRVLYEAGVISLVEYGLALAHVHRGGSIREDGSLVEREDE